MVLNSKPRDLIIIFCVNYNWTCEFKLCFRTRGQAVPSLQTNFNPLLPDYEEVIRKPSGMVRIYGILQNARYKGSDCTWTPEKVYLYKYDSGDPCGRSIGAFTYD